MKLTIKLLVNLFAATFMLSGCTKEGQTIETKVPVEVFKKCKVISGKTYNENGVLSSVSMFYYQGDQLDSTVTTQPQIPNYHFKVAYYYQSPTIRIARTFVSGVETESYRKETLNAQGDVVELIAFNGQDQVIYRSVTEISCQ